MAQEAKISPIVTSDFLKSIGDVGASSSAATVPHHKTCAGPVCGTSVWWIRDSPPRMCTISAAWPVLVMKGEGPMSATAEGSGRSCRQEPAGGVTIRKHRASRAEVVDEEGRVMPPGGRVGPEDRAVPGHTSGA
jgi:hypothetical protein